jgi:hypothetical protein
MSVTINASTSSGLVQSADTSGTVEIQSNGTTKFTVASTGAYGQITSGTAVASTSGTSIDFTGIPSWAKRITVCFSGVSTNGTSPVCVLVGTSSGIVSTGYTAGGGRFFTGGGDSVGVQTTRFLVDGSNQDASTIRHGHMILTLFSGNTWVQSSNTSRSDAFATSCCGGSVALSATLDRLRITTINGTDTFDAGSINILYEG